MARLFTGIEIPEDVKDQLSDLQQPLPGVRWIDDDDLHLTLRFVGDIEKRMAEEFALALSEISHVGVFEMRLSGLGTFGGRDVRQIWAGVESGPELRALARAHERAAQSAGLPVEKRTFKPHVTIARARHSRDETIARFLARHGAFRSHAFTVSHASMFSAKPITGGGPYVVEERFSLAGVEAVMGVLLDPDGAW